MASLGKIELVLEGGVLRLDCGVEGLRLRKGDCLDVDLVNKTVHVWRDDDAPALPRGKMPFDFIWISEPRIALRG